MFEKIIGNQKNKEILEKAIKLEKLSHSYIFWGIEGIGKKIIAEEVARKILCIGNKEENCNCKSCIEINSKNNPDFCLIQPNEGKIKIEQIREMQKKVAEKPIISSKKVYIIDNAETMTTEAQNCLLKTLEEPPEYITIILIASNENTLLSTIKSRCTRMYFEPIEQSEIEQYIKNNTDIKLTKTLLDLSQGSIGKIIRLKEKEELYEKVKEIIENIEQKDLIETINTAEEIYKSKEEIASILEYINVLAIKLSKKNIRYIKCIEIVENTKKRLKANSNYDMCIDNMLFNIWEEINEKNSRG